MSSISEAEGAKAYETLLALLQDEGKALQAYRMMALAADVSDPLPSYCSRIAGRLPFSEDMLLAKWREVRDAFEADRVVSSVLSEESPLFPRMEGACFPFIYAAGNISLLLGRIAVFLGSPQPSIQAKSDTLDAVAEFISQGGTVLAPMEPGIPAFALQLALKLGGRAIGVLASPLSKCPSEGLLPLQKELYANGLLLSVFSPYRKTEKWFQKIRNSFISSMASSAFLAEEKDGGPSWAIADSCLSGGVLMMPEKIASNPSFQWMARRLADGALPYSKPKDIRRILPKKARSAEPDLFS